MMMLLVIMMAEHQDKGKSWMKKKRSQHEIIYDILSSLHQEKNARKTKIMQMSYLDWRNFDRYFRLLQDENCISRSRRHVECYELTEKGLKLLKSLKPLDELRNVDEILRLR